MNDREALAAALAGQNLYHGRHGTTPAGMATAMAILAALASQGYAVTRSVALDVDAVRRVFADAFMEHPSGRMNDMEVMSVIARLAADPDEETT